MEGCREPAPPWGHIYDFDHLQVRIFLCRRHGMELDSAVLEPREAKA